MSERGREPSTAGRRLRADRLSRRDLLRLGLRGAGAGGIVLASPWLAACGGTAPSESEERRELLGPLPVLRDVPKPRHRRGGTLRIGSTPDTLARVLLPLISATLVAVDPRSGEVYGDLAERIEPAGDLAVAFTLREDARFHPNTEGLAAALTADDVRRDFAARSAAREHLFSEVVERVEAPDPRTVVLHMKAPYALLFESLADPEQAAIRAPGRYAALDLQPGAGPFIPGLLDGNVLLLGANQLYHRPGLPLLEAVSVQIRADRAGLDELAGSGGLDLFPGAQPSEAPPGLPLRVVTRPSRGLTALALAAASPRGREPGATFEQERVRRAVSLVLDRDALVGMRGAVLSGPVGPAFPTDALPEDELRGHSLYRRHPQAARGLLDAAGRTDFAFTVLGPDTAEARELLHAMEQQAAEGGMQLRPAFRPPAEWEAALRSGEFEAALFESPDLVTPDAGLRLHTSVGLEGGFSPWGYSNPVYDAAVRRALTALSPIERGKRSRAAQRTLLDSVPALLPISAPVERAWVSTSLQGFEWEAHGFNDGWLAALWRFAEPGKR